MAKELGGRQGDGILGPSWREDMCADKPPEVNDHTVEGRRLYDVDEVIRMIVDTITMNPKVLNKGAELAEEGLLVRGKLVVKTVQLVNMLCLLADRATLSLDPKVADSYLFTASRAAAAAQFAIACICKCELDKRTTCLPGLVEEYMSQGALQYSFGDYENPDELVTMAQHRDALLAAQGGGDNRCVKFAYAYGNDTIVAMPQRAGRKTYTLYLDRYRKHVVDVDKNRRSHRGGDIHIDRCAGIIMCIFMHYVYTAAITGEGSNQELIDILKTFEPDDEREDRIRFVAKKPSSKQPGTRNAGTNPDGPEGVNSGNQADLPKDGVSVGTQAGQKGRNAGTQAGQKGRNAGTQAEPPGGRNAGTQAEPPKGNDAGQQTDAPKRPVFSDFSFSFEWVQPKRPPPPPKKPGFVPPPPPPPEDPIYPPPGTYPKESYVVPHGYPVYKTFVDEYRPGRVLTAQEEHYHIEQCRKGAKQDLAAAQFFADRSAGNREHVQCALKIVDRRVREVILKATSWSWKKNKGDVSRWTQILKNAKEVYEKLRPGEFSNVFDATFRKVYDAADTNDQLKMVRGLLDVK